MSEENSGRRKDDGSYEEQITNLRIEVAVLKSRLGDANKAVDVSTRNSWATINSLLAIIAIAASIYAILRH